MQNCRLCCQGILKGLEDLEVGGRVETIQTTALLRTARILRRVLETWGDLLSLRLQWKLLYSYMPYHNFTIINKCRKISLTKYLPLTLLQGFEKVIQGLRVTGSWRPKRNCNILTPTPTAVNVVSSSFSKCSTWAHSAGWRLSLLHLISNFSGPQTPSGFPRAPSAGCGFTYHSRLYPSPTLLQLADLCLDWVI